MDSSDAFWTTNRVLALVGERDIGGLVRHARRESGLTQNELARAVNVSTSTLSRFESSSGRSPDVRLATALARQLGIPAHLVGAALGIGGVASPSVTPVSVPTDQDEPIDRRSFLTLAGFTLPGVVLGNIDNALAGVSPSVDAPPGELERELMMARRAYDRGENHLLLRRLPRLLTLAEQELEVGGRLAAQRYCDANNLATDLLDKVGLVSEARVTAQNSVRLARDADSPLLTAAAGRGLSIVLRHEGKYSTANRVSQQAAAALSDTALNDVRLARGFAQAMCTHAYVAAQSSDRTGALDAMEEADRVAAHLTRRAPDDLVRRIVANTGMYRVSVYWALGDAGAAVEVGKKLDTGALPTPERRARHHTDMARAYWRWGKPDETARALVSALVAAREEVVDRPRIRKIAQSLSREHSNLAAVRYLSERLAAAR